VPLLETERDEAAFGLSGVVDGGLVGADLSRTSRSLSSLRSTALSRSSSEGRSCAPTPTPVVIRATVAKPRITNFNFPSNMALSTPSVRVTTEVETTPVREEPDATRDAPRIVESASMEGTVKA